MWWRFGFLVNGLLVSNFMRFVVFVSAVCLCMVVKLCVGRKREGSVCEYCILKQICYWFVIWFVKMLVICVMLLIYSGCCVKTVLGLFVFCDFQIRVVFLCENSFPFLCDFRYVIWWKCWINVDWKIVLKLGLVMMNKSRNFLVQKGAGRNCPWKGILCFGHFGLLKQLIIIKAAEYLIDFK